VVWAPSRWPTLPFNGVAAWTIGGLAASGAHVVMSGVEIAVAELLERDGET
jgi:hypothetical protein